MVRRFNKATGWHLFVRTVVGRAYPRVIGMQRQPGVVLDIVLPLIGLSAYVFVYRALHAPETFVGFVILGGAMMAFWLNVLWSMANQLFWEKEVGNLGLYIMAPGSLMAILLGMAIGGMAATSLRAAVILALGIWFFHVHFAITSVPLLAVVFAVSLAALYGMGMLFASLFLLLGREGWHYVNLAQEPVYLLSGTYFPVKSLNGWVAAAASLIPLTLGLDATRQLVFAGDPTLGLLTVPREIAVLVGLGVTLIALSRLSLGHMERLAIGSGTLTESRG
jgi:ABC-2 type transport system permease protein